MATAKSTATIKRKVEREGVTKTFADALRETNYFAVNEGDNLRYYENGCYQSEGDQHVLRQTIQLSNQWRASKMWSTKLEREVLTEIRRQAPKLWNNLSTDSINVRNGLLTIKTLKLEAHSPSFLSSIQLPVDYDKTARCPAWDRQIRETLPSDCQELIWEILAWLILPERRIQQAILLLGDGANGKSTLLQAITNFLGQRNVSTVSLQQLDNDKFAAAELYGKLANICSDLPGEHLAGTAMFKAIVSGDSVRAQRKYQEPFTFRPSCKLLFSANMLPQSNDTSYAFFKRWIIVPFDRRFTNGSAIPSYLIDKRLSSPTELSGALNKALAALPHLRQLTSFQQSPSMRVAWSQFQGISKEETELAVWLDRTIRQDQNSVISKITLYEKWKEYATQAGQAPQSPRWFGVHLQKLRPLISTVQKRQNGRRIWSWQGIAF